MKIFHWVIALAAASVLAACNPVERAGDARAEVDFFHERLNAGDDDAIWAVTGEEFRSTTSKEDFARLLGTVRKSLGKVEETSQVGMNMYTNMQGSFTTLRMETHFERGRGAELFMFKSAGDELKLVGYNINSPDMMSDVFENYADEGDAPTTDENLPQAVLVPDE